MPWQPIDQLLTVESKLGAASAEFPYSPRHWYYRLAQCAVGLAVGVLFVFLAIGMAADWKGPAFFGLLALAILGVSCYNIYLALAWPHLRVKVFPAGLISIERDRFFVLYWGQVESVWDEITIWLDIEHFSPGRRTHVVTVKSTDGEQIKVKNRIQDVARLSDIIEAETTRRLVPKAIKTYNEGAEVGFGYLGVSKAGLRIRNKLFPWETIANVKVTNGSLLVKEQGKFLGGDIVGASSTPNLGLLMLLIETICGQQVIA